MSSLSQFGIAIMIIFTYFEVTHASDSDKSPVITKYKDIFISSLGGKPRLGTTKATCWARGGTCLPIRFCRSYDMDFGVPGCTTGYRVCCKNFKPLPPTVGAQRSRNVIEVDTQRIEEIVDLYRLIAIFILQNED